jgi:hypothetical protein
MKKEPKSKGQIIDEIKSKQNVEKQKSLVRAIFPLLSKNKSIYDAQTALNAVSGFISFGIDKKIAEFKVSEIEIDLSKEEDSEIKKSVVKILDLIKDEDAKALSILLEKLGNSFAQFGAAEFLKNPMKKIKVEDIVAK